MKTNMYLFGTNDVPEFDAETLMRRTELLKDNLQEILDNTSYQRTDAEATKIAAILKAIDWHDSIPNMGEK